MKRQNPYRHDINQNDHRVFLQLVKRIDNGFSGCRLALEILDAIADGKKDELGGLVEARVLLRAGLQNASREIVDALDAMTGKPDRITRPEFEESL